MACLLCFLLWCALLPAQAQDVADILEREAIQMQYQIQELKKAKASEAELQGAQQELNLITARNERFTSRLGGAIFKVYGFNAQISSDYLRQATAVYQQFRQLFPEYQFSPQTIAHLLVYPDPATYLKFERMPYGVAGHAQSRRIEGKRYRRTHTHIEIESNNLPSVKLQRLALYQAPANSGEAVTFGHELSHLFTWDLLNQSTALLRPEQPSLFLNEGLAEYMATLHQPHQQQWRLHPLRQLLRYVGPAQWLDLAEYPPENYIREFYSEAYLFVRWLASQPEAGRRLQALLKADNFKEFSQVLQNLPTQQPVTRITLEDYDKFRKKILMSP